MTDRPTEQHLTEWKRLAEVATLAREYGMYGSDTWYTVLRPDGDAFATFDRQEDAEFYQVASRAVPALLAEVARLREHVTEIIGQREAWEDAADRHLMSEAEAQGAYAERIIGALGHDPNRYDCDDFPENVIDAVARQAEQLAALLPLSRAVVRWASSTVLGDTRTALVLLDAIAVLSPELRAELEGGA